MKIGKNIAVMLTALVAALVLVSHTGPASAQTGGNFRTWVSGTGVDTNSCTPTNPCGSVSQALSQTTYGGEVICLGSGGRYDADTVVITGPVTIDCHGATGGQEGSVQSAGTIFTINAPGAVVTLRGLNIDGLVGTSQSGVASDYGINIRAAAVVNIEDCVIENFVFAAIQVATAANTVVNVRNTTVRNASTGIGFVPTAASVNGSIDHVTIAKTRNAIAANAASVFMTVTNSLIVTATEEAVHVLSGSMVAIDSSSVTNNDLAFVANGGVIRISQNVIYNNVTNFSALNGGVIASSGDNDVAVNGSGVPNGSITRQ